MCCRADDHQVKVKKIVNWVYVNVEKKPVLSVPNALEVLKNKVGDCNEHAVLTAALLRTAGIPAQIETGLVYLHGRFYYHAWNIAYIGKWVTVDAVFNQMPADVTHIRLVRGEGGEQLDLLGFMGKIQTGGNIRKIMIDIINLTKDYGTTLAVNNLSLNVASGEIYGFIGPNGAGKTTTIRLMGGIIAPTSGSVIIDGYDMAKNPVGAKKIIGFVPDRPFLYEKLTGREFLKFSSDLYSVNSGIFERKSESLLKQFALWDWANEIIEAYSHGMKQRLIIAAALLHDPKVLIIDEPMVGLDPTGVRMVKDILRQLAENNVTIFLSTHTLSIAEDLCHRIGVIHKGTLLAQGTLPELNEAAKTGEAKLEEVFLNLVSQEWEL